MIKFINNLSRLILILIIGFGVWSFNHGLRLNNYQLFFSNLFSNKEQIIKEKYNEKPLEEKKEFHEKTKEIKKINSSVLQPYSENKFSVIDEYSRNVPTLQEKEIETLALYLQQETYTDLEKARAIYIWITDNISYDDDAYNSKNYPKYTPLYVLTNKTAVCEGYSNLYMALGKEMGLEIKKVSGYSKGYGYQEGEHFTKTDHSWNIIKINNEWKIFDSTWGRGNGKTVDGKLKSFKKFNDYWFNVSPYEAVFTHFPKNTALSFVMPPIDLEQYEKMLKINSGYFKLGFNGKETFNKVLQNPKYKTPKIYSYSTYVKMIKAPKNKFLRVGESYYFEFYIPRGYKVATIDAKNKWTYFKQKEGLFKLDFAPSEKGNLKISVQHENSKKSFETILLYAVQ